MDCRKAEALIGPFIRHKLPHKELKAFLAHIETCPSCRDELETQFFVERVIEQLDDTAKDGQTMNILGQLEIEISHAKRILMRDKVSQFTVEAIVFCVLVAVIAILVFLLLGMIL